MLILILRNTYVNTDRLWSLNKCLILTGVREENTYIICRQSYVKVSNYFSRYIIHSNVFVKKILIIKKMLETVQN